MLNTIMFHHFHGAGFGKSQGSISAETLNNIILNIGVENFVTPEYILSTAGVLDAEDKWLLTFDDGLLCQFSVALPVLEKYGLKAFWFIHSMPLEEGRDYVESYRDFRTKYYQSIEGFHSDFFSYISIDGSEDMKKACAMKCEKALEYLSEYTFYTNGDRVYRYIRDVICDREAFYNVMDGFIESKGVLLREPEARLFMSEIEIKKLSATGHEIGLHSHTHYTKMSSCDDDFQNHEYIYNYNRLDQIISKPIQSVSYPCGSYNVYTLELMEQLGIKVGFRSNNIQGEKKLSLEMPRIDHINYITMMEEK
ncbi:polysaccharide deacetylase family protein [Neptunomonas sp.]|uniref:polysaccharide deacetylase family protein n=1 Tax=Neptunomonas sp. TaxID=1971898 RepID=UPI003569E094